jgi:Arc/MetJ-type ribon-helix-helix transcriptional regulator
MADGTVVTLKLNQQQLELVDRTVASGVAPDRAALVRLALREYAAAHSSRLPHPFSAPQAGES